MFRRQPRSPPTTALAPLASTLLHLRSAIAAETSPNLTEKVPPKPQHSSQPSISLSWTPLTFASSARGCSLMPMLRRPVQESW